jgi:hypothetical protein
MLELVAGRNEEDLGLVAIVIDRLQGNGQNIALGFERDGVDTIQRSGTNDVFLLQQPEVHLHPSTQAELGSYFAQQVKKNGRFVIETHSDYIVDRIRMEVRKKTLRPEDVSLLYFERGKRGAMIHHLEPAKDGAS